jgi:hypothetical protein
MNAGTTWCKKKAARYKTTDQVNQNGTMLHPYIPAGLCGSSNIAGRSKGGDRAEAQQKGRENSKRRHGDDDDDDSLTTTTQQLQQPP